MQQCGDDARVQCVVDEENELVITEAQDKIFHTTCEAALKTGGCCETEVRWSGDRKEV